MKELKLTHIALIFNEQNSPIKFKEFKKITKAEKWAKKKTNNTAWHYQIHPIYWRE